MTEITPGRFQADQQIFYDQEAEKAKIIFDENDPQRRYWTEENAQAIAAFLKGESIKKVEFTEDILKELAYKCEPTEAKGDEEGDAIDSELAAKIAARKKTEVDPHYEWWITQSGQTVLRLVRDKIEKLGLRPKEDYRLFGVISLVRADEKKSFRSESFLPGFKHEDKFIPEISTETGQPVPVKDDSFTGLMPEEGGDRYQARIHAPRKKVAPARAARGLAHELGHVICNKLNDNVWDKLLDLVPAGEITPADLDQYRKFIPASATPEEVKNKIAEIKKRLYLDRYLKKRANVASGGYMVGSREQGSESVGDLFKLIVDLEIKNKKTMNLSDLATALSAEIEKSTKKGKTSSRYFVAKEALHHHVKQLIDLGCGDVPAAKLLAIGLTGNVTFEKAPFFIRLGVVDHNYLDRVENLANQVKIWLTHEVE